MQTTYDLGMPLVKRLQALATPFVDHTPIHVIERCVEFYERHQESIGSDGGRASGMPLTEVGVPIVNVDVPPKLVHTRVSGSFAAVPFSNWNELVRVAHEQAYKVVGSFEALAKLSHAQLRQGSHSENGFHFVPQIECSIQGVDSNHAWEYSLHLARAINVPLQATVYWRHKEGAAYPGESRELSWTPQSK